MRIVSSDYLKTMRIPIRSGRPFDRRDTATAPEVVLINERTAQQFFTGVNPIGHQTFWAAGCLLAATAVLATYVPARRAASVEPTDALRTD
jgi:hypothetical protein